MISHRSFQAPYHCMGQRPTTARRRIPTPTWIQEITTTMAAQQQPSKSVLLATLHPEPHVAQNKYARIISWRGDLPQDTNDFFDAVKDTGKNNAVPPHAHRNVY